MMTVITFTREVSSERVLHNLSNIHKTYTPLRRYIRDLNRGSGMYSLKNDAGEIVAECHVDVFESQVSFTLFKGELKKELQKMIVFRLVEEMSEKGYVSTEKMNLYYDLDNFFLIEKEAIFKIGLDYETILPVEIGHIPVEIRLH